MEAEYCLLFTVKPNCLRNQKTPAQWAGVYILLHAAMLFPSIELYLSDRMQDQSIDTQQSNLLTLQKRTLPANHVEGLEDNVIIPVVKDSLLS